MKSTLYFPGLRPDDYFIIGNVLYMNNPLFGIRKKIIVNKEDMLFYFRDKDESAKNIHVNSYRDPHIFSLEEFTYLKNFLDKIQKELKTEDDIYFTPRDVYLLIADKAKEGEIEAVLLFHRFSLMFKRGNNLLEQAINFVKSVMEHEL